MSQHTVAQAPSYVPTDGLVGYWPFDGNAIDASGNGNNGVVNGATLTSDRNNSPNSAYSFDGDTDYIDIENSQELELTGSDYSISLWTYFNSTGSDLISKRDFTNNGGYSLTTNSTEYLMWHWGDDNTGPLSSYSFSEWINVTIVYADNLQELKLYVNGILQNTTPLQSVETNSGKMRFGGDAELNTYWHNGMMDDIGIWNRTLTQQEITDLYDSNSLAIDGQSQSDISIYPNPVIDKLFVQGLSNPTKISVYNILGKLVFSKTTSSEINVDNLQNGIYIVKIVDNQKEIVRKFIKN